MRQPQLSQSYIVRVLDTVRGKRITVQDLRTREMLEFDSWEALSRHMHLKTFRQNVTEALPEDI